MIDFNKILSKVPDYKRYLSVDELDKSSKALAKEHSNVELLHLGKTKGGNEIIGLKIGSGKYNALVYGFPNPEEPVGGLVCEYFANALAENEEFLKETDYTWYIIKCIDPDGAKLNDGFIKGEPTPYNFTMNYYRSPLFKTGEECFPYRYGDWLDLNSPTAETLALMKIMTGREIHFISSLHNMKFASITYQVSEPCPPLYAPLAHLAKENGIFLRKRTGFMFAPGVQWGGYFTPVRNYINAKAAGKSPIQQIYGAYVFEYALQTNPRAFMMTPECCTWYDKKCFDDSPVEETYGEVMKYVSTVSREASKLVVDTHKAVKSSLTVASPFKEMMDEYVDGVVNPKVGVIDPDPVLTPEDLNARSTVGHKLESEERADVYKFFYIGGNIRMIDYQIKAKGSNAELKSAREKLQNKLDEYNDNLKSKYDCRHWPLKNLVAMNLGSILYSAEYAKNKTLWHETFHSM